MYLLVLLGSISITSLVTYMMLSKSLGVNPFLLSPSSSRPTSLPTYVPSVKPSTPTVMPTLHPSFQRCANSESLHKQNEILCNLSNGLQMKNPSLTVGWSCNGTTPYSPICYQSFGGWTGVNCSSSCTVISIDIYCPVSSRGTISSSIGLLSALRSLQITDYSTPPNLFGTIPTSIGLLSALTFLHIFSHSKLSGTIPTSLAALTLLRHMDLSFNALTGQMPNSNTQWPFFTLTFLDLSSNRLVGPIYNSSNSLLTSTTILSNRSLTSLITLSLSGNSLTGTIPSLLYNKLTKLNLNYNSLSGAIPSTLCLNTFNSLTLGHQTGHNFTCFPACLSSVARLLSTISSAHKC